MTILTNICRRPINRNQTEITREKSKLKLSHDHTIRISIIQKTTEYIEIKIIECQSDQKEMWKNLKKIVKIEDKIAKYDEIEFEETIDRGLLLKKLQEMAVENVGLKWFENYLSGRMQQTKFNDGVSKTKEVDIGVPQGSCLAPILFILYINDLNRALDDAEANLFADGTAVALADNNIERAINRMNE